MDIVDSIRANREIGAQLLEREYKPRLIAVASRFCSDKTEVEALVYRTMDEAVRHIETLTNPESFFGWMCGIMSNQYGKLSRRKINEQIVYPGTLPEVADDGAANVVKAIDEGLLREAIDDLPPKLRETVLLRYFMDMPLLQIARFLTIPVGTVNSRLHMARTVLAMRLGAKLKKPAVALVAAGLFLLDYPVDDVRAVAYLAVSGGGLCQDLAVLHIDEKTSDGCGAYVYGKAAGRGVVRIRKHAVYRTDVSVRACNAL